MAGDFSAAPTAVAARAPWAKTSVECGFPAVPRVHRLRTRLLCHRAAHHDSAAIPRARALPAHAKPTTCLRRSIPCWRRLPGKMGSARPRMALARAFRAALFRYVLRSATAFPRDAAHRMARPRASERLATGLRVDSRGHANGRDFCAEPATHGHVWRGPAWLSGARRAQYAGRRG